jgi:hypothetical protein
VQAATAERVEGGGIADGAGGDGGLDAARMRMVSCRESAVGEDEESGTAHGGVAMPFEGAAG